MLADKSSSAISSSAITNQDLQSVIGDLFDLADICDR